MANRRGDSGNSVRLYFWGSKITADGDCNHQIKRRLLLGRKVMTNLDSILKSRDITLPTKVHLVKAMVFPVVMYGCKHWTVKKAEHRKIDAFELWCWRRPLRVPWSVPQDLSPLGWTGPKGDQSWVFIGKTDAEAETPVLWPPHGKSWLIGKYPDAGRDWGQEEKGMTENEVVGWHHWLDGHEFEQTPGVGDGQGGLACCNSWGRKESDTTEQLNGLTDWLHFDIMCDIKSNGVKLLKVRNSHIFKVWEEQLLADEMFLSETFSKAMLTELQGYAVLWKHSQWQKAWYQSLLSLFPSL